MYLRDYTPNRWPVGAGISSWNGGCASNGSCGINIHIDLYHRTAGSCPRYCVSVYNAAYGSNLWSGYTYAQWDSTYHFISGAVNIHLNDSLPADGSRDLKTATHEIGHVMGLGHAGAIPPYQSPPAGQGYVTLPGNRGYSNSCMVDVWSTAPNLPSTGDLNTLRYILYP